MQGNRRMLINSARVCSFLLLVSCLDKDLSQGGPDLFDLWCGDVMCNWEVVEGEIERVPTWHERDLGVELVDFPVEIEQINPAADYHCILFELVADVQASSRVSLGLDFWDDGVVEYRESVPESNWRPLALLVPAPTSYQGFRFFLRKEGEGRAVLAQFRATESQECRPVDYPAPDGWRCAEDADCLSGTCGPTLPAGPTESSAYACGQCAEDRDCSEGEICGIVRSQVLIDGILVSAGTVVPSCLQPGSGQSGEVCINDRHCASGFCDLYEPYPKRPYPQTMTGQEGQYSGAGSLGVFYPLYDDGTSTCHQCRDDGDCGSDAICGLAAQPGGPVALCESPGSDALGDTCLSNDECAEGLFCSTGRCFECFEDAHCQDGRICDYYTGTCIDSGSRALAALCLRDEECASGVCVSPFADFPKECSECRNDDDCAEGESCITPPKPADEYSSEDSYLRCVVAE